MEIVQFGGMVVTFTSAVPPLLLLAAETLAARSCRPVPARTARQGGRRPAVAHDLVVAVAVAVATIVVVNDSNQH